MTIPIELFDFAYCPKYTFQIGNLSSMACQEDWTRNGQKNSVLLNYIAHTFKRLAILFNNDSGDNKGKWITFSSDNKNACFNTGLFTSNYNRIFALFVPNSGQQKYKLKGFFDESSYELVEFNKLPNRATYFSDIKDLIFDTSCELRINLDHILNDNDNFLRIPKEYRNNGNLKTLFNGAIEMAKKRISSNYNIAVPQFYEGGVQLLIPISLGEDLSHTDLVLAVSRKNNIYLGKTCLTLDMAYNNARLIAKPEVPWIQETKING